MTTDILGVQFTSPLDELTFFW